MPKIIIDTREQYAWNFSFFDKCTGTIVQKLPTGDYSIEGLEEVVTIERKRTTAEIAMNVGSDKRRFTDELVRMSKFKYKYIICEFSFDRLCNFPEGSGIPKGRWEGLKLSSKYLVSCLLSYKEKYGIEVIFCDNYIVANQKAIEILDYVYENEMVK